MISHKAEIELMVLTALLIGLGSILFWGGLHIIGEIQKFLMTQPNLFL